jgi:transcription initiation factor TFIID TATA-box-binding protein
MRRRRRPAHDTPMAHDSITGDIDLYNAHFSAPSQAADSLPAHPSVTLPPVMVHNVVGTAKVFCSSLPFDLQLIHSILPNSTFKKKKFAAITIRLFDPHCTVLLFASGKMVLTGCRDFLLCVLATHKVIAILRQAIPCVDFECSVIQMQNIVGHVDMDLDHQNIDLELFYRHYNIECTFQRSMFPGLVYRAQNSAVVMLIFASGRLVITGGRCMRSINAAWHVMKEKLAAFLKPALPVAVSTKKRRTLPE